jgi:hypothetical protein
MRPKFPLSVAFLLAILAGATVIPGVKGQF